MKSLLRTAALISALMLVPAFALAEEVSVDAQVNVRTSTTPPKPRLGPAIKNTIQGTRGIKSAASSTRDTIKARVDAVQGLIGDHKADVRLMVERKRELIGSTTAAEREEKREEARQKLEEKRAHIEARALAAKQKAQEKFGEAVQKSVGNIVARLKKRLSDFANIADRIDARIDALEAQGKDMSLSVTLLTEARADIAAAQDNVAAASAAVSAALSSTNPKAQMQTVREAVQAAEEALKAARESLKVALESVRVEAQADASADASATTP